ncbi:MAG: DUF3592 domain-containing protein [Gammaproteobacteria bacterium]|nr:DUF3592 domain-containing protein [Gammaproteobacteria bacterium]
MDIKSSLRSTFWAGLSLAMVLSSLTVWQTWHFLQSAVRTEAQIVKIQKKLVGYTVTLRFRTKFETVLDASSELFQRPAAGQRVAVVYNALIPAQVRVDSFFGLWSASVIYLSVTAALVFLLYSTNICFNWKTKKQEKLKRAGNHIYTCFSSVEAVVKVNKKGQHPYQIISSWKDIRANKTYLFKSKYLWHNPVDYIMGQTITVIIDSQNKKNYLMDLSFLPEDMR